MTMPIIESISLFYPEIILTVTLCAAIIGDLLLNKKNYLVSWIVLAGLAVTAIFLFLQSGRMESVFNNMVAIDQFGRYFKWLILISGTFIVIFSMKSRELENNYSRIGEYYMLITGALLGMFLMVSSTNMLLLFLGFELTSISSYILAGFTKKLKRSAESSTKYVIYGAVASGVMLYGISLLAGISGSLNIYEINEFLRTEEMHPLLLFTSGLMIIVGFGYKIAAVPFHFWAPDVYEGSPLTITAFLAVVVKIAAFAMMIRILKVSFINTEQAPIWAWEGVRNFPWSNILAAMAILTMLLGNLAALSQDNLKRLLAYSSIAHAGYILLGLIVMTNEGIAAMMVYLFIYIFMNLGAFFVIMVVSHKINSVNINDYKGLGYRAPLIGIGLTVFLVALTGLPPTAGFIAKLYIFGAAINAGWIWLVIIAGVASIISLYYYMRIVRNMFLFKPVEDNAIPMQFNLSTYIILIALMIPTLIMGVYFSPLLEWAKSSVKMIGV